MLDEAIQDEAVRLPMLDEAIQKLVVGECLYIVTLLFGMWFYTKICPEATNAGRGHSG